MSEVGMLPNYNRSRKSGKSMFASGHPRAAVDTLKYQYLDNRIPSPFVIKCLRFRLEWKESCFK